MVECGLTNWNQGSIQLEIIDFMTAMFTEIIMSITIVVECGLTNWNQGQS